MIQPSLYKAHYVVSGKGILHTIGRMQHLSLGDLFFTFPGFSYFIESVENFSYMYISFLGNRANMILERLNISPSNYLICDCSELCEYWRNGIDIATEYENKL